MWSYPRHLIFEILVRPYRSRSHNGQRPLKIVRLMTSVRATCGRGEQKAAVSDSGYSQIAGDTPATTGVQLMRSDVLAGDGVQLKLVCCRRSLAPTLVALPSMSLIPFAPFRSRSFQVGSQQHCISLAPARLDRFPRGPAAAGSLIPFAPFSLRCSSDDVPGMSRM